MQETLGKAKVLLCSNKSCVVIGTTSVIVWAMEASVQWLAGNLNFDQLGMTILGAE
jgi:hypothetical protein